MPNDEIVKMFKSATKEVHVIGDCKKPSLIVDAMPSVRAIAKNI